jgi:predicted DNA-binding protein with PD1-like motif
MQSRLVSEQAGEQTFVLVFARGDEAMQGLREFAREHGLSAARFSGIGAFSRVVLGYFDWQKKDYQPIRVDEQVEVLALVGDVALDDGDSAVHAHAVVAGADGSARGGHLLEGHVRPTLEIVLTESPAHLRKRYDAESGLALIALDEPDPAGPSQGDTSLPRVPDEEADIVGPQAQRILEEEATTPRSSTEEGAGLEP